MPNAAVPGTSGVHNTGLECEVVVERESLRQLVDDELWGIPKHVKALLRIKNRKAHESWEAVSEQATRRHKLKAQEHDLERSGTGKLLRALEAHMRDRGMRIFELFLMMDKSGDGLVDRDELMQALLNVTRPGPGPESRLAQRKHMEAVKAERAADAERARLMVLFRARMKAAEESGAAVAFERLERYMRKFQIGAKELFAAVDKSGDGSIDADELFVVLKAAHCPLDRAEVGLLADYLDEDGSGQLSKEELQAAVNDFRKYKRAKKDLHKLERRLPREPATHILSEKKLKQLMQFLVDAEDGTAVAVGRFQALLNGGKTATLAAYFRDFREMEHPEVYAATSTSMPAVAGAEAAEGAGAGVEGKS